MTLLYDWLKTAAKQRGNAKALVYRDNYLSWYQLDEYQSEAEALGLAASMGADVEPEPNRGRPDG